MKDEPLCLRKSVFSRDANWPAMGAWRLLAFGIGICLLLAAPAVGQTDETTDERLTFTVGDDWSLSLFPGGQIYEPYIADPFRPGFAMMRIDITENDLPDTGTNRYGFMLGGHYGLLKLRPGKFPGNVMQIDIYGAYLGQFDPDNGTDNIGWEGLYGFMFTWAKDNGLAVKLAMEHDSSHLGDEYIERTGRQRINYTRDEMVFGLSYRFPKYFRVYGEAGYGYRLRNRDLQEPWRVGSGIEFENPDRFFGQRVGYYAAVDLSFTEEMNWNTDFTAQAGFVMPVRRLFQTIRVGPFYRSGRSIIGEFFQYKEKWWGLGVWIDI